MNVKPSVVTNALNIAKKLVGHAQEHIPNRSGPVPIPLELDRDRAGINAADLASRGFADGGAVERKLNPQGLYSQAAVAARALGQAKGSGDQMLASLKGVKPDELKHSGAHAKFAGQKSVTRDELAQHFDDHLPEIHETQLGGVNGNAQDKFRDYTIPGGHNYRELLLHEPETEHPKFQHNHWDMPNVLAHLRMKDRKTHDGKKALHLEELQSDWGQAARQKGVRDPEAHKALLRWNDEAARLSGVSHDAYKKFTQHDKNDAEGWQNALMARNHADLAYRDHQQLRPQAPGVVDAPYIGKTEGWADLGLKRALMEAAKGGHDKLVWTPGQEQADRYDLSKKIDQIEAHPVGDDGMINLSAYGPDEDGETQQVYDKRMHHSEMEDHIGKDIAAKLRERIQFPGTRDEHFVVNNKSGNRSFPFKTPEEAHAELANYPDTLRPDLSVASSTRKIGGSRGVLSGLDLKVGGEGMKGFYDNIVPKRLLALAKEHDPDAQLGVHDMEPINQGDGEDIPDWQKKELKLPGLDITPKMRESILKNGFKGYNTGGFVGEQRVGRASGGATSSHSKDPAQAGEFPVGGGIPRSAGVVPAPSEADGPLIGLPTKVKVGSGHIIAGPDHRVRGVAGDYMRHHGMPYNPPKSYAKVDPERAARIAQAFEDMPHDPHHPLVKAAYGALHHETMAQYHHAKKAGLKVDFWDPHTQEDPYAASPRLATEDIRNNHHMFVFPTHHGYGSVAPSDKDIAENPMLADSGEKFGKHPAMLNDIFRAVHDYYGHAKEGVGFRADGEENAWRSHAAMFSPLARLAMTGETRGQNSWLNYGPHGEQNRNAKVEDTIFAPQKVGAIAPWVMHEGAEDMIPPGEVQRMHSILRQHRKDGGKVDSMFDMSALHETPNVPQFDLPRNVPKKGTTARVSDLIKNKDVIDKMMEIIATGKKMGGKDWYNADPLRKEFTDRLGGDHGNMAFQKYMDFVAATSPRSKVGDNIRNASYYFHRHMTGQGVPNVGDKNPQPYGHLAQKLHQRNANTVSGAGWDPYQNPKPASFAQNLVGNQLPATIDAHAFKLPAMLARDPRFLETAFKAGKGAPSENIRKRHEDGDLSMDDAVARPVYWHAQPKDNEYGAMEGFYKNLAHDSGMTPAQAQASGWIAGGKMTGLGSEPKPFLGLMSDRIHKTAVHHNMDPKDVLDKFVRGDMPLRASGGRVEHKPSEAQKQAGNYRKEHVRFQGLDISIENKRGSQRSGIDPNGKRWSCTQPADYGYIKRTTGADGDHVDVYIGPDKSSQLVFIINQHDHRSGAFDEHKCMLGFNSEKDAAKTYCRAFSDGNGPARIGSVETVSIDAFKHWLRNGNTKKRAKHDGIVRHALKTLRKK